MSIIQKNQDKKKEKNKFSRHAFDAWNLGFSYPRGVLLAKRMWVRRQHSLVSQLLVTDFDMDFEAARAAGCPPPTAVTELQWGEPRLHAFGTSACVAGSISSGLVLLPLVSVGEEEGGAGQEWQACPSLSPYCGVMLDTYTLSVVVVGSCCPLWVTIDTHRLEVANLYLASGVGLGKRKAGQSGSGQSMELLWCNVPPDVLLAAQALGQTTA
ncbi:hypothetical protein EDB86DRAFT_2827425 [Lactarius hatsudake]|nr:hypothetical protein EDB86DRAFT_2827425 [Lactarius hatsudake]